jgi:hypothetical protein
MKPLNQKERTKAYQKVVGLFVLCFALAMVLGFTTMNVNKLTDTKTKTDLQRLQSQLKFQQEVFAPNVEDAGKNLAKVPAYRELGENVEVLNSNIASILSQTINQVPNEDSWESNMYKNILKIYSDLQLSYKDQLRMKDDLNILKNSTQGSDKELQRCLEEKRNLQNEINLLKLAGGGGGGGGNTAQLEKDLVKAKKDLEDCNRINNALRSEIDKLRSR